MDVTSSEGYPYSQVMGDNSAAIGTGLGYTLSNLQPSNLVYDPFQFQRPQYMAQLSQLASDPSLITSLPGYGAGIESVKRGMSKGYLDSGNMALSLANYGQDLYFKQLAALSSLAGSGIGPTNVGSSIVGGRTQGADLISRSLGTQRYDALKNLSTTASNPNAPFWGPPDVSGTRSAPYPSPRGGQPPQSPGSPRNPSPDPNAPGGDWMKELEDTFGMPYEDIMNMIYPESAGNTPGPSSGGYDFGNAVFGSPAAARMPAADPNDAMNWDTATEQDYMDFASAGGDE